ncbi:MAG: helix-turn-helix domain-containing protein [Bacteroidales bacterium]|nr:helix-turn-helix domain-containing protein [Bacteroidales bacterium]
MSKKLKKDGLLKKQNVRADASLKYNVSNTQLYQWRKIAKTQGYDALAITRPRGRPSKN